MNRRSFLKGCAAAAVGLSVSCRLNGQSEGSQSKPNILFFLTDDQRYSLVNAYGIEKVITPTMDSFVKNGVNFTNTYMIPFCHAPCQPSRASILSGRSVFRLYNDGKTVPPEHKMIQESLQDIGYTTFVTGKWHNGEESARGFDVGKNVFFGGMSGQFKTKVSNLLPNGKWSKTKVIEGPHSSEIFSDAAIEFLESQKNSDKPFYAYVAYKAPHDPRDCPQKYMDMYNLPNGKPDPAKVKLPPNYAKVHPNEEHPFDNGHLNVRDEKTSPRPRVPEKVLGEIRDYYAITTHLDTEMARVMKKLNEIGKAENTIIVFAGDNGLGMGQHSLMGKQNLYEHSIKVPLVFVGKGLPSGKTVDSLCYLHDIYPTICDITKANIPATVKGKSLAKMFKDQNYQVRQGIYTSYRDFQRSIVEKRYKLIEYNVKGKRTTQLFDLKDDPWEMNNLARNAKFDSKVKEMRAKLLKLKEEYNDNGEFWDGF